MNGSILFFNGFSDNHLLMLVLCSCIPYTGKYCYKQWPQGNGFQECLIFPYS